MITQSLKLPVFQYLYEFGGEEIDQGWQRGSYLRSDCSLRMTIRGLPSSSWAVMPEAAFGRLFDAILAFAERQE